ncbi:MAG: ATP-binding cassette domain-containing protein [Candidatus Aminicenantes bacterium]|nr:ATP-binding cassette domain-containing protein [Candidatus Aminicenantes bacterium]
MIKLENITKTYVMGENKLDALKGISYTIKRGAMIAIMGPSGSGKSTLMNVIGCLDKPTSGTYYLENELVSKLDKNRLAGIRNKRIGFVFQNFNLLARTSALENVELPLVYSNVSAKETRERAQKALQQVGLKGREDHKTNQLSGGEKQRVAIARALVNHPSLILADEPTGNLDTKTGIDIMEVFKSLHEKSGITVVLVTHDPEVTVYAEKVIHLRDGLIENEKRRET